MTTPRASRGKPRGTGRRERSGGNSTGKAVSLTESQVNDLVCAAHNLAAFLSDLDERIVHLMGVRKLIGFDLDRVMEMCETLSDGLVTRTRAKGPKGNPVAARPSQAGEMRELNEDEWTALLEEVAPLPKKQLSFYDGTASKASLEG